MISVLSCWFEHIHAVSRVTCCIIYIHIQDLFIEITLGVVLYYRIWMLNMNFKHGNLNKSLTMMEMKPFAALCQRWAHSVMWTISVALPLCPLQWRTKMTFNMLCSLSLFPCEAVSAQYLSVYFLYVAFTLIGYTIRLCCISVIQSRTNAAGIKHKNRIWLHRWVPSKVNTLSKTVAMPSVCCVCVCVCV